MIPSPRSSGFFRLNKEHERRLHVEDPKSPHNKIIMEQPNLWNYVVLSNSILFMDLKVDEEVNHLKGKVWYINFDGVLSGHGKGDGLALKSPLGHIFKSSYRLEFEANNNVVEYEALLLGLKLGKDLKIKFLSIKVDLNLVIMQAKNKFSCKNDILRK